MRTVRVYDATRVPHDWNDIIQPGQFVVFASLLAGGAPCGVDGTPTSHADATCVIADSIEAAEALCRDHVERHPEVRFDIFDAHGRSRPALLTVVHPARLKAIEGNAATRRRNRAIALALIAAVPVLIWIDWRAGGALVLPSLLAFNALLFAVRLLQVTAGEAAAERRRLDRLAGRDKSR